MTICKMQNWHLNGLQKHWKIITPGAKPNALAQRVDVDSNFKKYAEDIMCTFNVGITSITSEKKDVKDFFGKDNENELDEIIKKC